MTNLLLKQIINKISLFCIFSQFYALLEMNPVAMSALQYRPLTIFAPTNQAFQRFKGNGSVLYHICKYLIYFITFRCLRSLLLTFIINKFCLRTLRYIIIVYVLDDFDFLETHALMHVLIIL